jgi:hypothetical protein
MFDFFDWESYCFLINNGYYFFEEKMKTPFIGRKNELKALNRIWKKNTSSLIVIKGRRRIGKSRLVEEFASSVTYYVFSGIPPHSGTTAQSQRDEFSSQLRQQMGYPKLQSDDWNALFWMVNEKIPSSKQTVILFDEISWIGSKDPDFLGKLKNAWDIYFKKHPRLILILCGSASTWIEKNILSSTGFLGRISYTLTLEELPLNECVQFWHSKSDHIAAYEKFKMLSVTGGVPRYLEELKPDLSAEANIKDLCFISGGLFVDEFERIFSDLFSKRSPLYKKIVRFIAEGPSDIKTICQQLKISQTGMIGEYLEDLKISGFISRDFTWNIKSGMESKLSKYRLSDNYLRFYLKYIEKRLRQIQQNQLLNITISNLPGWHSMMGMQFENLVLNNRLWIKEQLSLDPEEIIIDNPFFQRKTQRYKGCQIDYMIQTKYNTLYVCEIKFSRHPVGTKVIQEVKEKIQRLSIPRGVSCRSVLIHVNGITEDLQDKDYFSDIIDFSQLLAH